MATIITTTAQTSARIDNPIIVQVISESISDVAFHNVRLYVEITSNQTDSYSSVLNLPVSFTLPQTLEFNIRSCYKAASDRYEYQPVGREGTTFPAFVATLRATDTYVMNGLQYERNESATVKHTAYMGGYSDYQRRINTLDARYSLKPEKGELACPGDLYVWADRINHSSAQTLAGAVYTNVNPSGQQQVTLVPKEVNSRQFQFVNSRGCIESIRAFARPDESAKSETKTHTLSRFERFSTFSRTLAEKHEKPGSIKMSSGWVSPEWARWWIHEFGASRWHWMLNSEGHWLQVLVELSDGAKVIERSSLGMCYVEFTVSPDMNGDFVF